MFRLFFVLLGFVFCLSQAQAQTKLQADSIANADCVASLELLSSSYESELEGGYPYQIYAFKNRKTWVFILISEGRILAFKPSKYKKSNELERGSVLLKHVVCGIVSQGFYKSKDKPKEIANLKLKKYYKLKRKARRALRKAGLLDGTITPKKFLLF
ncbi:MAG: hypothetical protein JJT94_11125 [Bernardetiaceae bacterium]|nr:hypothetical protein [Bernardetiaceae bacterium]